MNLFSDVKAAEVAAFFLYKSNGQLPILKLMKLMYLAERESFKQFHYPLIGDYLVSMPHGPVLSLTYDRINGNVENTALRNWLSDRENYNVSLKKPVYSEDDLLELSENDLTILNNIWDEFGTWDKWKLVNWTHNGGCPEWEDPHGSSYPITLDSLFTALNFDELTKQNIKSILEEQKYIQESFASC